MGVRKCYQQFSKTGDFTDPREFPPALRKVGLGVESWKPQPFPKGAKGKEIYDQWVLRVIHLLKRNPLCQCANPECAVIFANPFMLATKPRDYALCELCRGRWRKRTDMEGVRNRRRVQLAMICASVWDSCGPRPKSHPYRHSRMVAEKANVIGKKFDWFSPISGKWVTWHLGWIQKALSERKPKPSRHAS